jgi:hypothetical protein
MRRSREMGVIVDSFGRSSQAANEKIMKCDTAGEFLIGLLLPYSLVLHVF